MKGYGSRLCTENFTLPQWHEPSSRIVRLPSWRVPHEPCRSRDRIGAKSSAAARPARGSQIERVDEGHQRLDVLGHVREEAGLEVPLVAVLGAEPGPRQVG